MFFSDLKSGGKCSFVVEARLLRYWEARNVKRGGELMWVDMLMIDVDVSLFRDRRIYYSLFPLLYIFGLNSLADCCFCHILILFRRP